MDVVPSHDRRDAYREITQKIAAAIEAGAGAFVMPWHQNGIVGRPLNAATQKPYRGVNILSLWVDALSHNFGAGYWATYRQWRELGAQVRKGARGSPIVFYRQLENDAEEEDTAGRSRRRSVLRASFVFNIAQVDGWEPAITAPPPAEIDRVESAELLVARTGATIVHRSAAACYAPALDRIEMPDRSRFVGSKTSTPTEAYYSTLFHELSHWTGHEKRLKRDLRNRFGSKAYAAEELVAELGAAFLCADVGIANSPRQDHAAYVADWLSLLADDPRALMSAAAKASAAAEFIAAF